MSDFGLLTHAIVVEEGTAIPGGDTDGFGREGVGKRGVSSRGRCSVGSIVGVGTGKGAGVGVSVGEVGVVRKSAWGV